MLSTSVAILVAPVLAAASTLASRRWGPRTGGVVSAFPAIVGPVLVIVAVRHGELFAARAAGGTLLGLVGLAAFAVAYGRVAATGRGGWGGALAAGWLAAALGSLAAAGLARDDGSAVGLVVATASLAAAHRALARPGSRAGASAAGREVSLPVRMALTATLVLALATAAGTAGAVVGGMLAALPVLASILAVLTHRDDGAAGAVALLRGMLAGMAGFVVFCEVVALLVVPLAVGPAFLLATAAAVAVQTLLVAHRGSGERGRLRQGRQRRVPVGLRELRVLKLPREERVVGAEVEVTVATQAE